MKYISANSVKTLVLALACTLVVTLPNYTWVPTRIEAIHPGELNKYWLSFAFRFFCLVGFFWFQAHCNIHKMCGMTITSRLGVNILMMFVFIIAYLGISALTPLFHLTTNRGMQVVVYQVVIVGIVNIMISLLVEKRQTEIAEAVSEQQPQTEMPQTAKESEKEAAHYQDKILLPTHDRILPIATSDIAGIYTSDKKTHFLMVDGRKLEYNKTLQQIMQTLDPDVFFRANKQYIVARSAVKDITVWFDSRLLVTLIIEVPEPIYVPKNKAGEFKQWLAHV